MKVITPIEVRYVVDTVSKHIEKDVSSQTKSIHSDSYVTNALDALASSARAGLNVVYLTKKIDVLKKHSKVIDAGVEEFIQGCKDGSRELEAVNDILSMIEKDTKGLVIDKRVLRGFSKDKKISDRIVEDLERVRKNPMGIKLLTPILTSKSEAMKKMSVGDVFQVAGDKVVSIKNRKGEIEPLKMSKSAYEELFPPVSRYASYQGDFGHCYEVTALNAVMERPEARENLLRCIDTESEKGLIKIKFENSSFDKPIVINPSKLDDAQCYTKGCLGLKYIEHALGLEYEKDFVTYKVNQAVKRGDAVKSVSVRQAYEKGDSRYLARRFGAENDFLLGTNLRDGGFAFVPWYKLGFAERGIAYSKDFESSGANKMLKEYQDYSWADDFCPSKYTEDEDSFLEKLWDPEFFKTHLVEASVGDVHSRSRLSKGHSYRLSAVFDKDGNIESYLVKDPHGILEEKLSVDGLLDEIDSISYSKIA